MKDEYLIKIDEPRIQETCDAYFIGIRKLTPIECFYAQGYPKYYELPTDMSDARLYKQAGNSVIVPVINRIAENIMKALN